MKTILFTLAITLALAMTGCATDPATVQTLVDAHKEATSKPTISLKCPAGSCEFEYTDPRDRAQLKLPTNGWDALTAIGNNVTSVIPVIAMGGVAMGGFKALQNSGGSSVNTTTTNTTGATSSATTTNTLSGTGVMGSGTYNANPTTTTTNPAARVCGVGTTALTCQ